MQDVYKRQGHLFEPVPYDEPEAKELKTQALTEEKLDVIEVLDRRALFSNGRLMPEQIPEGDVYKRQEYDRLHIQAQRYKELYPKGTRILLLHMGDDPRPVEDDMRGTVRCV